MFDFWFDFSSPFAYLASTQVEAVAARTGVPVRWRPFLLGALFRAVGQVDVPIHAMPQAKQRYIFADLQRFADLQGVPLTWPSDFPLRTLLPLRAFLAHPEPIPFAHRVFAAAWGNGRNIAEPAVLLECGATEEVLATDRKQALIDSTAAAVAAGVFGAPAFVVRGQWLFWGNDRLDQVERCLRGWDPPG